MNYKAVTLLVGFLMFVGGLVFVLVLHDATMAILAFTGSYMVTLHSEGVPARAR